MILVRKNLLLSWPTYHSYLHKQLIVWFTHGTCMTMTYASYMYIIKQQRTTRICLLLFLVMVITNMYLILWNLCLPNWNGRLRKVMKWDLGTFEIEKSSRVYSVVSENKTCMIKLLFFLRKGFCHKGEN